MATYEHLPLRRLEGVLPRRQHGYGQVTQRDAKAHGAVLQQKVETVIAEHKARPKIADIDPSLILKIKLTGVIDEDEWRKLGLTLLSNEGDSSLVLFADDTELKEFRYRLAEYQKDPPAGQKNPRYANIVGAIEWVAELDPADRIGPVLRGEGKTTPDSFPKDVPEILDAEIWRPNAESVWMFVKLVESHIQQTGGTFISEYKGPSMTLVRFEGGGDTIRALLELSEILSIDRPPHPDLPFFDASAVDLGNIDPAEKPDEGAFTIGVIDSGLSAGHPLLGAAVTATFGVPPALGDNDERGHGTPVSGIAVYGDVRQRAEQKSFKPDFHIASAKLVNAKGEFDPSLTVPKAMELAIRKLHDEHACRVINISLADPKRLVREKPSPWAAVLDELARELDLIIVVAAGNREKFSQHGEKLIEAYPACLLEEDNRIFEPGSAVNVLTVGSIAHSNGIAEADEGYVGVMPFTEKDHPSPFTRVGPGVGKMIKPDFVDYGGTLVFDGASQALYGGQEKSEAGVVSLNAKYLERLLRASSGTSFSAPLVAYKAAYLREVFPEASANLIRALMAISAEVPDDAAQCLSEFKPDEKLMVLGNGVIDLEHALNSDDNRVVLYREDTLEVDKFAVFEVPIPELFQQTKGVRTIRVSLAFDPPTRHTRLDYSGLGMSFDLYRGMTSDEVFDACRKWEEAEGDPFKVKDSRRCGMKPGPELRGYGTLQNAVFTAKAKLDDYGDTYYLVVRCHGGWASTLAREQRFAVAVELEHEAQIALYNRVQQRVKLRG